MKLKYLTLTLATLAFSTQAFAQSAAPAAVAPGAQAAAPATPKTPEEWLARMTDFTRNSSAFRDPRVFVPWSIDVMFVVLLYSIISFVLKFLLEDLYRT